VEALIFAEEHPGQARVLFEVAKDYVLEVNVSRTVHTLFGLAKEYALWILESQSGLRHHWRGISTVLFNYALANCLAGLLRGLMYHRSRHHPQMGDT
jgi:hypothetical protein